VNTHIFITKHLLFAPNAVLIYNNMIGVGQ
jgi:hypothetical protein